MAGVSVEGGRGRKKELNTEINMVPMIDLLMVTISFLLITAVWTHMSRLDADAQVPRPSGDPPSCTDPRGAPCPPSKRLHIDMTRPDRFVLTWKEGITSVSSVEVPRRDVAPAGGPRRGVRFPELAAEVGAEWQRAGLHRSAGDRQRDEAVLHTADGTSYSEIIAAIDAVYQVERPVETRRGQSERSSAFNVVFAAAD